MILICEHSTETLERTCKICEGTPSTASEAMEIGPVGIDENNLVWFYVAPGYEHTATSRALLAWARDLMGPDVWAVMQASHASSQALCKDLGLEIVTSYENEVDEPSAICVHVVNTGHGS